MMVAPEPRRLSHHPCTPWSSFAKTYKENVYKAGLPVIVFGAYDLKAERKKLEENGVKFRDDFARPEWGIQNLFEDTFGNLILFQERPHPNE